MSGVATLPARIETEARWVRRHLLDVADVTAAELDLLLDHADAYRVRAEARGSGTELAGRRVILLFFEASTRTRVSFELAARLLGADVVNVSVAASSVSKGESLVDTVRTLGAVGGDVLVVRHERSGAAHVAARNFPGHVINAGDGWHAHPTQALLDLAVLRRHLGSLAGRKVVILGDLLHSRVARSNVWTLTTAGADLWLCGPPTLLPGFERWARAVAPGRSITVTADLSLALAGAEAVMALRLQRERQQSGLLPSLAEYHSRYGLTRERLGSAAPGCLVLHPGPMNEGVEIAPDVAHGSDSVVEEQVAAGVGVRAAVMALLAAGRPDG